MHDRCFTPGCLIHGTVTSMAGRMGIVCFDGGKQSAYLNPVDGCEVSVFTPVYRSPILRFRSAVDMARPDPKGTPDKRRVVCVLNTRDWVKLWAYETEYSAANVEIIKYQAEARRKADEAHQLWDQRRLESLRKQQELKHAQRVIESLGYFQIWKAHKFREEDEPRTASKASGEMKLANLLLAIEQHKLPFERSASKGRNDTLHMWFERMMDGARGVRVELSDAEMQDLLDVYSGTMKLDCIQPILERLSGKQVLQHA